MWSHHSFHMVKEWTLVGRPALEEDPPSTPCTSRRLVPLVSFTKLHTRGKQDCMRPKNGLGASAHLFGPPMPKLKGSPKHHLSSTHVTHLQQEVSEVKKQLGTVGPWTSNQNIIRVVPSVQVGS